MEDNRQPGTTSAAAWHVRAVRLPNGRDPEDWWIVDGRLTDEPVPGARELPGGWVLPGLADAHAHLSIDFNGTGHPATSPLLIEANMRAQLHSGVLALRDAGLVPGARHLGGPARGPRVIAAGGMHAPGGRFHAGLYTPVAPEALIDVALAEVAAGAPWVKVIADFPGPDGNWFAPIVNYPPELLRQLADAVHAAGGRVAAHVSGPFVREVVHAGVDSIEHGPLMDEGLVRALADRGGAWTPTLWTVVGAIAPLANEPGPVGSFVREVLARLRELIPLAAELGVPVLAGSDEAPHGSLVREIARLQEFGLAPAQAIAAASTAVRAYLGLPAFGRGAPADLVTYAADPRADLGVLAQPAAIMFGGARVR